MSTESMEPMTRQPVPRTPPALGSRDPRPGRRIPLVLPALLSAGLLWLSFFPANIAPAAWVALVPLLVLVRSEARARWVYPLAFLTGLVFYFAALQWLRHADDREMAEFAGLVIKGGHLTWSALAIYSAFYVPVAIFLLRRLDRRTRLPLTLTVPVVWIALEFIRAHLMTGFPWYFLGHTQHGFLPLIQVSDLAGAYAVSFVVAAVNGVIFELLCTSPGVRAALRLPDRESSLSPRWQLIGIGVLFVAVLGYGFVRLSQEQFVDGPRVALLQGNLPQSLRNLASSTDAQRDEAADTSEKHFDDLADLAAADHPDLIVWPETSAAYTWHVMPDGSVSPYSLHHALVSIARWKTNLLIGTNSYRLQVEAPSIPYNSAILLQPTSEPFVADYAKVHRVPFGEYVPLRDTFEFMNTFAPYDFDYSIRPGPDLTRFPLGDYHFGVLICFEDSDPYLARQFVTSTPPLLDRLTNFVSGNMFGHLRHDPEAPTADFLLNLSNDAWFNGSSEHDEHLAVCRFRAVECRRSVARAVNMGISAVIDGSGRIVKLPGDDWSSSKKVAGVVTAVIPIDYRWSLYAHVGDWLPALCLLVVVVGIVWPRRSRGVTD
jgi:apolipoprotein N-acyltransferase